jgi:hypothetical protein
MTPYARKLLGMKPNEIFIPRKLIYRPNYDKLIKKIFFRRWKRNLNEWELV